MGIATGWTKAWRSHNPLVGLWGQTEAAGADRLSLFKRMHSLGPVELATPPPQTLRKVDARSSADARSSTDACLS